MISNNNNNNDNSKSDRNGRKSLSPIRSKQQHRYYYNKAKGRKCCTVGLVLVIGIILTWIISLSLGWHASKETATPKRSVRHHLNDHYGTNGISSLHKKAVDRRKRPSQVGYYFYTNGTLMGYQALSDNKNHHNIMVQQQRRYRRSRIKLDDDFMKEQLHLQNERYYDFYFKEPFETESCVRQEDWQVGSFPTCNSIHETDISMMNHNYKKIKRVQHINNGFWRDIWLLDHSNNDDESFVLKTMRYEHDMVDRNYDRHRKDALASERLTYSPYIMNIYGFCGNSATFEYSNQPDLEVQLLEENGNKGKRQLSWKDKFEIAIQVSTAIAHVHNTSTIVHTDINPSQFIPFGKDNVYKLGDFNRCRFLAYNPKRKKLCGFRVANNPGMFRAPEEYAYEAETEKIDVYSLGNIFYVMLMKIFPFENYYDDAPKKIKSGERASFDQSIINHPDPFVQTLYTATNKCWRHNPKDRPTAYEIQTFLTTQYDKIKQQLEEQKKLEKKNRRHHKKHET